MSEYSQLHNNEYSKMVRKLRSFHIRNLSQRFAPAPIDKVPYCYSFGQQIVRSTGVTKDQNAPLTDFPTNVTFKPCKSELLSCIVRVSGISRGGFEEFHHLFLHGGASFLLILCKLSKWIITRPQSLIKYVVYSATTINWIMKF